MTDNEIVKALELCATASGVRCRDCPYRKNDFEMHCAFALTGDALDLINRQQAEIEMLTETLNATIEGQKTLQRYIAVARADAVKDFSALLVSKAKSTKEMFLLESLVESVMKEMGCRDESKT